MAREYALLNALYFVTLVHYAESQRLDVIAERNFLSRAQLRGTPCHARANVLRPGRTLGLSARRASDMLTSFVLPRRVATLPATTVVLHPMWTRAACSW